MQISTQIWPNESKTGHRHSEYSVNYPRWGGATALVDPGFALHLLVIHWTHLMGFSVSPIQWCSCDPRTSSFHIHGEVVRNVHFQHFHPLPLLNPELQE